ncbi:hypothetical protein LTR73_007256 [Friedmanniomyces endolithicus]|nr:hypothetical protein LTR73_007256 [Friedmanniomyces endolithicus]
MASSVDLRRTPLIPPRQIQIRAWGLTEIHPPPRRLGVRYRGNAAVGQLVGGERDADVPGPVLAASAAGGEFGGSGRVVDDDEGDGGVVARESAEEETVVFGFRAGVAGWVLEAEGSGAFEPPVRGEEEGALEGGAVVYGGAEGAGDSLGEEEVFLAEVEEDEL